MSIVSLLGESAVRSLALNLAAGLALRLLRVQHARLAKRVWTSVLLLSLAMPALVALGVPSVSLTALWSRPRTVILAAPRAEALEEPVRLLPLPGSRASRVPDVRVRVPVPPALQGAPAAASHVMPHLPLWRIGFAAYLAITSLLLLRIGIGLTLAIQLWRHAQHFAVSETRLPVRLSADLRSPATVGRGILLPLEAITWDRATLIATLAHEQEHVREGDFYLQLAGAVHHCFFWISPHAWWLRPQLSRLSETVCDRAAVASTGDGLGYAQLLLRFAGAERSRAAVVAMAQSAGMRERIEQLIADPLLSGAFYRRRGQSWALGIAVAAMAIPAAITVHIVQPAVVVLAAPQLPAPPAAQAATAMQPDISAAPQARSANPSAVPAPLPAPLPATDALPHSNAAAPVLAIRPNVKVSVLATPPVLSQMHLVVPVAAPIPMVLAEPIVADTHVDVRMFPLQMKVWPDAIHARGYAIYGPDGDRIVTMHNWSGASDVLHEGHTRHPGGAILFQRDGSSWIIDDPALVKRAQQAYAHVQELGRKQGELGEKQGDLGTEQGRLGDLEGKLSALQGELAAVEGHFDGPQFNFQMMNGFDQSVQVFTDTTTRLALDPKLTQQERTKLEADQKKAQADFEKALGDWKAQEPQWKAMQQQIREQAEQMAKQMQPLVAQMRELGAKQGELGRLQGEYGRQQGELGRAQEKASSEADRQVQSLIDQAVKDGKAHPVQ